MRSGFTHRCSGSRCQMPPRRANHRHSKTRSADSQLGTDCDCVHRSPDIHTTQPCIPPGSLNQVPVHSHYQTDQFLIFPDHKVFFRLLLLLQIFLKNVLLGDLNQLGVMQLVFPQKRKTRNATEQNRTQSNAKSGCLI